MKIAAYRLGMHFPVRGTFRAKTTVKAVDDVYLQVRQNEIVGLVGESGSGKSTLGRCVIRLLEPTSGDVLFDVPDDASADYGQALRAGDGGQLETLADRYSLLQKSGSEMRELRRNMNIVFQDPYSSLNPRWKLTDIISEPMVSTRFCTREEAKVRSVNLLKEVGLPEFFEDRYPHELSGGQRQRVAIARAIGTNPSFLVLDEPTSALDVSVQAQILNMLRDLRDRYGISMLLITHNIAVVAYLAERVYVMYAGKIMESGEKGKVLRDPQHPYTKALMSAVPVAGEKRARTILRGDPPNLIVPPVACRFHPRCPVAFEICGWTGDEVAEDLEYLLRGKYFATFGDDVRLTTQEDGTILLEGVSEAAKVTEIVRGELEEVRSLTSIRSIEPASDGIRLSLHEPVDPQDYALPDGREVNCLLFRPKPGALPAAPTGVGAP